ncbi:threonine/homoserine/homoserine lactone efflux protein [Variovorax paradoxus]|uniref:LysE family translocator n=1 Tax=Variovorax paradoxus TaxID=34073 RepID=UPI00278D47B5|nr:LysE family translocator [Variovorax paradoxus]MDQ0569513.1 threonine/homoserine/homoserine lactone efflux protein [Variovorax paradoxus]
MPDTQHLLLFIATGWLLNLAPGPDVLYIVTHSLRSGTKAGLVAGLGITAGGFVHIFAAALGMSALLATSATAFATLKWIGVAYLLWVGTKLLLAKAPPRHAEMTGLAQSRPAASLVVVFLGGFWTNVLNPKVAMFFLAFVPQFIAPDAPDKAWTFVLLGTLFKLNSLPFNCGWALAAGWMARHGAVQSALHRLDRVAGAMFAGFGIKLALTDIPSR